MKVVFNNTIRRSKALDTMANTSDDKKLITECLTSVKDQFITERTNDSIEQYAQIIITGDAPPVANRNAMQSQEGCDTTIHMKDMVPYGKLGTRHVQLVKGELRFRGLEYNDKLGIRTLTAILKTVDVEAHRLFIKNNTGNKDPTDE